MAAARESAAAREGDEPTESAAVGPEAGQPDKPKYNDVSAQFYVFFRGDDDTNVATALRLFNTATREKSPYAVPVEAVDATQFKIVWLEPVTLRAALVRIRKRLQGLNLHFGKESLTRSVAQCAFRVIRPYSIIIPQHGAKQRDFKNRPAGYARSLSSGIDCLVTRAKFANIS